MLSTDSGQRTLADGGRFKGGKSLMVQAVEDVELIAYHSCQPTGPFNRIYHLREQLSNCDDTY